MPGGSRLILLFVAGLFAVLAPGAVASAATHATSTHAAAVSVADTTCPTNGEGGGTIACGATTTAPGTTTCTGAPILQVSYANGSITWQAYNYPSSADGTTVSLFVNGVSVSTAPIVDTGGGCGPESAATTVHTASIAAGTTFTLCLQPGSYNAVAVDSGLPDTNTVSFSVPTTQTCANPTNLTSSATAATPSSGSGSGALAFTGANVARLGVIALCAIAIGAGLTKLARRRRLS